MSRPTTLQIAWTLARPKTLGAAVGPVLVGGALAWSEGARARPWVVPVALASALCIQIVTNLVNDAADFERGADDEARVGPRRATQAGWVSAAQVKRAALAISLLAVALALPLVWVGGTPLVGLGLVCLLCAWAYTAGPAPLAYHGLGDPFVLAFFGPVAVLGTAWLMGHGPGAPGLLAGVQVGALATVLIAINNLRDRHGDARVGKRTLAVRLGPRRAKLAIVGLVGFALVGGSLGWLMLAPERWLIAAMPWAASPLALSLTTTLIRTPAEPEHAAVFNALLARAGALHVAVSLLIAAALLLSAC